MSCLKKTTLVHEDQRLTHFAAVLQKRIAAAFCSGAASVVLWNNILFVDQDDPGDAPAIGYLTNKYESVQDAVDAAQEGDLIYINPGTYSENVDLSNIADNVVIQGSIATTISALNTANPTVSFNPAATSGISSLMIKDISIVNSGDPEIANTAVYFDLTNDLGAFANGSLSFKDVVITGKAVMIAVNELVADNLSTIGDTASLINVSHCNISNSKFDASLEIDFDFTGPQPTGGRNKLEFYNSKSSYLALRNTPWIYMDSECVVTGTKVGGAIEGLLEYNEAQDTQPMIEFHGRVEESVLVQYYAQVEDSATIANFDHAEIGAAFIWTSTAGPGGENIGEFIVLARNAVFAVSSPNAISADGTIAGGLGTLGVFDISNSTFSQNALDTTSFAIDRTIHMVTANLDPEYPNVVTVNVQPPYYTNDYQIHAVPQAGITGTLSQVEVANRQLNSFDAAASIATSCTFTLIQQL